MRTILSRGRDVSAEARGRLFDTAPPITEPDHGKHWYVDSIDYPGYCAACGTPRRNTLRHVARPGVAT